MTELKRSPHHHQHHHHAVELEETIESFAQSMASFNSFYSVFNCAFVPDESAEKPFVLTDVLNK